MSIEENIHRLREKAMTSGFNGSHFKMYHQLRQDIERITDLILPEVKALEAENVRLNNIKTLGDAREKIRNIAQKAIDLLEDNFDIITLQGELDKESTSPKVVAK